MTDIEKIENLLGFIKLLSTLENDSEWDLTVSVTVKDQTLKIYPSLALKVLLFRAIVAAQPENFEVIKND